MTRDMDPVYRVSGLGRPLDPSYPTNRLVLRLLPVAAVLGGTWSLFQGTGWGASAMAGVLLALVAFVAWALTRELDPDGETAAFVSLAAAAALQLAVGTQSILVPAALLVAIRLVNRSTGKAAETMDTVLVVVAFGVSGWLWGWTLPLIGAAALGLDAALPHPPDQATRRYHYLAAAVVLVASAPTWIGGVTSVVVEAPSVVPFILAFLGLLGAAWLPPPRSVGDVDGLPLRRSRVRFGLVLGALGVLVAGLDQAVSSGALWAAWGCVGVAALAGLRRRLVGPGD